MRRLLIFIFCVAISLIGYGQAYGQLQKTVSVRPYLPAIHKNDIIVEHVGYTLCYNEAHEQANWVAYELTAEKTNRVAERTNKFIIDPFVPTASASDEDYKGTGYDRGHLAPAADMGWSVQSMTESFYYSNMSPQVPSFNRGIWKKLEEQVRDWAVENQKIEIATGPVLSHGLPVIGPNQVSVPRYYYKVILDDLQPELKCIGFILPNEGSSFPLSHFAVSVDSVEKITGIDFFPSLPDTIEKDLEANLCLPCWNWNVHHVAESPRINTSEKNTNISSSHQYDKLSSSVQCNANTKSGKRCRRMTKNKSGQCWQHEQIN